MLGELVGVAVDIKCTLQIVGDGVGEDREQWAWTLAAVAGSGVEINAAREYRVCGDRPVTKLPRRLDDTDSAYFCLVLSSISKRVWRPFGLPFRFARYAKNHAPQDRGPPSRPGLQNHP